MNARRHNGREHDARPSGSDYPPFADSASVGHPVINAVANAAKNNPQADLRADDLAVALTLRGYSPGIVRSRMKCLKAKKSDIVSLTGAITVLIVLILL